MHTLVCGGRSLYSFAQHCYFEIYPSSCMFVCASLFIAHTNSSSPSLMDAAHLFIHTLTDSHLGCLQFLAITN